MAMRINVWGINHAPELTGIAVYNTELCQYLASKDHTVAMVTAFPYYPFWRKRAEDRLIAYSTELSGNVHIFRCCLYVPGSPSTFRRILHELSFAVSSTLRQLTLPAPDVYIVVSPPLILGLAAWLVSRVKGASFHFHVQDLQPDAAFGLNMLNQQWLRKPLYALEKLAYDKACSISAISRQMCDKIAAKNVPPAKIVYFPNWVTLPQQHQLPEPGTWRASKRIDPGVRIVSYAGNVGIKQGMDLIVEAARLLKDNRNILFVIAGHGSSRADLEILKDKYKLDNLLLEEVLPEVEHTSLLLDSDICLVTQRKGSGDSFLPSKLLKTLALGRPVLTNAEPRSTLHQAVLEGGFGRLVEPDNSGELAAAVVEMLADKASLSAMGEAGKTYVARFSKEKVLDAFERDLQSLIPGSRH